MNGLPPPPAPRVGIAPALGKVALCLFLMGMLYLLYLVMTLWIFCDLARLFLDLF